MNIGFREQRQGELNLPLIYFTITLVLGTSAYVLYRMHALPVMLCPFKEITGHPCPTCGSTRMVLSLFRLDLWTALRMNPGVFAAGCALLVWYGLGFVQLVTGRVMTVELSQMEKRVLLIILAILFLLNWGYLWVMGV